MANFVLVHGSGQNARCWDRVAVELRALGHSVITPELPKRSASLGIADCAALVAAQMPARGSVVLAHSLCGILLPAIAHRGSPSHVVFLAAVVPEAGQSVRQQFARDPTMFNPAWIEAGPRWLDPAALEDLAREFLFHDCDAATLPWALSTVDPMQTGTFVTEPAPLPLPPGLPVSVVVADADRTLTPEWCRRTARQVLGVEPKDLPGGHCPQNSRPGALARLLVETVFGG